MFWYLASPYTAFPGGIEQAYRYTLHEFGRLLQAQVPVFSPIAHTHMVGQVCNIDPGDHGFWLPADAPFMRAARGIIVLRLSGWEGSKGVSAERLYFMDAGKPEIFMDPGTMPAGLTDA